ncbi:ribonuclease HI [Halobacteriovorax sp. GB3]|uniref:ribonuclease H family protein n=1 Tax=Halobacteriovorax sp. GB3 TaxID=2719615 RepID=UPI0023622685|nr:ribonuclease H [Halobacteriovorax sp. GB3]MDD0852716.1 ribonuclease HI [Halobacteriovorax sp. GB3]
MKEKYLKTLSELSKILTDEKSNRAITYLKLKIKETQMPGSSSEKTAPAKGEQGDFPLPVEVQDLQRAVAVFSDGACRGNPGPGAWGVMAQNATGEVIFESSGIDASTTNNRMELEGAIKGLELVHEYFEEHNEINTQPVYVYSDSRYVVDGIEKWVPGWKARGWKKADKKAPENLELWQTLDRLALSFHMLKFYWVKGHAGHPQNEHCDQLANKALDDSGF